jgi:hypothetical protein
MKVANDQLSHCDCHLQAHSRREALKPMIANNLNLNLNKQVRAERGLVWTVENASEGQSRVKWNREKQVEFKGDESLQD